jgi:hypothetical protein
MNLNKRFSIAHCDSWPHPSLFYKAIKNSSQQFRDELYDIYFGKIFRYKYQEQELYDDSPKFHEVAYGNVMGVEASNEQLDYLFRIQEEFGIEISLTINQLNVPVEIYYSKNDKVFHAFIQWLQGFYDRGLRSCTLANNHLMRTGILQDKFPEMKWKNTVNQQVSTAQQVLDYLCLGYNVVQLDRSLIRNMDELKRIKELIENYKNKHQGKYVRSCLLVLEDCMPSCPFKRAHDDLQIYHRKISYWKTNLGAVSCKGWRDILGECKVPRSGTNCFWLGVDTFKEYSQLVDIFKYGGRLRTDAPLLDIDDIQFGWFSGNHAVKSFSEIIANSLEPVNSWFPLDGIFSLHKTGMLDIKKDLKDDYLLTDELKILEQRLKNCKNQCYNCHLCDRTFGLPDIDSLMEL